MMQPSSLSLIANLQRRSTAEKEALKIAGDPASRTWITSLHLAACRRWLSHEPPRLVEAEATLHLLHGIAASLEDASSDEDGAADLADCPLPVIRPEETSPIMWRLMESLERSLTTRINNAER